MVSGTLTPEFECTGDAGRNVAMRRSICLATICTGLAVAFLCPRMTHAADAPPNIYPQDQPVAIVQEFASGWYLRGDIGWRTDTKIGSIYSDFPVPTGLSLNDVATGGGGGGYKAGWFRTDITADYSGRTRFATLAVPKGVYDAKLDTLVALANVYADLGTWSGITPYVGIGAGVANFWVHGYAPPNGPVNPDPQSKADFAWAYMAGVAWSFAPRWMVDFSYRRLNFGDVTLNPHLTNALDLKDLSANEYRIGLRYFFD
jgi:opacity protein-like surface antigen